MPPLSRVRGRGSTIRTYCCWTGWVTCWWAITTTPPLSACTTPPPARPSTPRSFRVSSGGTVALALDGSNHLFVANYNLSVGEYDATTGATINENFVTRGPFEPHKRTGIRGRRAGAVHLRARRLGLSQRDCLAVARPVGMPAGRCGHAGRPRGSGGYRLHLGRQPVRRTWRRHEDQPQYPSPGDRPHQRRDRRRRGRVLQPGRAERRRLCLGRQHHWAARRRHEPAAALARCSDRPRRAA